MGHQFEIMKKGDKTERKIVDAAVELFVRKGYHGTSVSDIMQTVKLTKGAFYAHFKGKGQLLLRIIEEYKRSYVDELIRVGNECQGSALDKFHSVITFSQRFAGANENLCLFLLYLAAELKSDQDLGPVLNGVYREFQKYIAQLISQGMKQGLFKEDLDPDLSALVFLAMHDGSLLQWMMNRSYIDTRRYLSTYRRMVFSGLLKE